MLFDLFGVPSLQFQSTAVLSLYARGMMTGVVLDVGDGVSSASAIYEGYSIRNATQRIDLGGRDVTQHLMQLLRRTGYSFHTSAEFEIVRAIKEQRCYVEPMMSKKESESDAAARDDQRAAASAAASGRAHRGLLAEQARQPQPGGLLGNAGRA